MSVQVAASDQVNSSNHLGSEYLTFVLAKEQYALDILKVQEIRSYEAVTQIANTPDFVKGVVNLRGKVVPIVDLRVKFNLETVIYDEFTVVIILNLTGRTVGVVVDGVSDVKALKAEALKEVPALVTNMDTQYITGLASVEDQMLVLVDIEKLMSGKEMDFIDSALVH